MLTTIESTRINADAINAHLANGGAVQITTYTRRTIYKRAHAGWFTERGGSLHVQHGRKFDCLSIGQRLLVGIRLSK